MSTKCNVAYRRFLEQNQKFVRAKFMLKNMSKKEFSTSNYNLLKPVCLRIHFPVLWLCANSGESERLLAAANHQLVVLALIGQGGQAGPQLQLHKLVWPLTLLYHVGNLVKNGETLQLIHSIGRSMSECFNQVSLIYDAKNIQTCMDFAKICKLIFTDTLLPVA